MNSLRARRSPSPHATTAPSLTLAVVITGALFALALVAGSALPPGWFDAATTPTVERVTYVAPRVVPRPAAPMTSRSPRGASSSTAPSTSRTTTTATPGGMGGLPSDTAGGAPRTAPSSAPRSAPTAAAAASSPRGGAGAGRVGIERPEPPPLTRAQMDSALRDKAARLFGDPAVLAEAVRMAKDAGERRDDAIRRDLTRGLSGGSPTYHGLGVRFGIGLPGGGSSAARRKRDAAVDSATRATLARAAERRRAQLKQLKADSLRNDSLRPSPDSSRRSPS